MSRASVSVPSAGRLMLLSAYWTRPSGRGFSRGERPSAPLPADPLGGVLEDDPLTRQRDADPVRLGVVLGLSGLLALPDHGVDLLVEDRRGPVEDPENRVEPVQG